MFTDLDYNVSLGDLGLTIDYVNGSINVDLEKTSVFAPSLAYDKEGNAIFKNAVDYASIRVDKENGTVSLTDSAIRNLPVGVWNVTVDYKDGTSDIFSVSINVGRTDIAYVINGTQVTATELFASLRINEIESMSMEIREITVFDASNVTDSSRFVYTLDGTDAKVAKEVLFSLQKKVLTVNYGSTTAVLDLTADTPVLIYNGKTEYVRYAGDYFFINPAELDCSTVGNITVSSANGAVIEINMNNEGYNKQVFGLGIKIGNVELGLDLPSYFDKSGPYNASEEYRYVSDGLNAMVKGLTLDEYLRWSKLEYQISASMDLSLDYQPVTVNPLEYFDHKDGDSLDLSGLIEAIKASILLTTRVDTKITINFDLKINVSNAYLSEAKIEIYINGYQRSVGGVLEDVVDPIVVYFDGAGQKDLSKLYVDMGIIGIEPFFVKVDVVSALKNFIIGLINNGDFGSSDNDNRVDVEKDKLSCGCTCADCLKNGKCVSYGEKTCKDDCDCTCCRLSCGCQEYNCLANGSCYDKNGVRICDGVSCGCSCAPLSCGCDHEECVKSGSCLTFDEDFNLIVRCASYGDCNCTCCRLSCGCEDDNCLANGSCVGKNGVILCADDCACECKNQTPPEQQETVIDKILKISKNLGELISGVSVGNQRLLLVLNRNFTNNLFAMLAVNTVFPDNSTIYLEMKGYDDFNNGYMKLHIDVEKDSQHFVTEAKFYNLVLKGYDADALSRDYLYTSDEFATKWVGDSSRKGYASTIFKGLTLKMDNGGGYETLTDENALFIGENTTIGVFDKNDTLLKELNATDSFSTDIRPNNSNDYQNWIDVLSLQIKFETTIYLQANGGKNSENFELDLTDMLSKSLYLNPNADKELGDLIKVILDSHDTSEDFYDFRLRIDVGMALDLTDSHNTELKLEISKEYKDGSSIKDFLMLGLYYVNQTETAYLSLPVLDIDGLCVKNVDLSGLLSGLTGIKWGDQLETSAASDGQDDFYGVIVNAFGLDFSSVQKVIDSIANNADPEENAKLAIAMGNGRIGLAINFALIKLVVKIAKLEDTVGGILNSVTQMASFDRIELYADFGDKILAENESILNELTLGVGLYLDKNDSSDFGANLGTTGYEWLGVEVMIQNINVNLGDGKTLVDGKLINSLEKTSLNSIYNALGKPVETFLEFPRETKNGVVYGNGRYVNLDSFGNLSSFVDLLNMEEFHINLGGEITLDLAKDVSGYTNPVVDMVTKMLESTGIFAEDAVRVNKNVTSSVTLGFVIEGDIDFGDWRKTEIKIELTYSRDGSIPSKLIGLYYWGDNSNDRKSETSNTSGSFYLDLSGLGLFMTKVEGISLTVLLKDMLGVDVTNGSLKVGGDILYSLLGTKDVTIFINKLIEQMEEPKVEQTAEDSTATDDTTANEVTRLSCGCTNPECLANGTCRNDFGDLTDRDHDCAEVIDNARLVVSVSTYIKDSIKGTDVDLSINANMINKILKIMGVDLTLPEDTLIELELKMANGFDSLKVALTSYDVNENGDKLMNEGQPVGSTIALELNKFKIGYQSTGNVLKDIIYETQGDKKLEKDGFSGINLGGLVGLKNNYAGSVIADTVANVLDALNSNIDLTIRSNANYIDASGVSLVSGKARTTTFNLTRIGNTTDSSKSQFIHGLEFKTDILSGFLGNLVKGIYWYQDQLVIDVNVVLSLFGRDFSVYSNAFKIPLDIHSMLNKSKGADGSVEDKTDISYNTSDGSKVVTAADLTEGLKKPIVGFTVTFGEGKVGALGAPASSGSETSNFRIDINPYLVGGLISGLPQMIVGGASGALGIEGIDSNNIQSNETLYRIYDMFLNMLYQRLNLSKSLQKIAEAALQGVANSLVFDLMSRFLPLPTVTDSSECFLLIELTDEKVDGNLSCVRKVLLSIQTPATGEYWEIQIDMNGLKLAGIDTSLPSNITINVDDADVLEPVLGNLNRRTVTDVFDLDYDKNGIVDYMENLPTTATINKFAKGTVPSGTENTPLQNLNVSWADSIFQIDPSKGDVTYYIEGYVLNYVQYVEVYVPQSAARKVKYDEGLKVTIDGEDYPAPIVTGSNFDYPVVLEAYEVKDFISSLPSVIYVTMTDGNGENEFIKKFDGTPGTGSGVVEWDASELSESYLGGVYKLYLTFGDGVVGNYQVVIPVTVNENTLNGIIFPDANGGYENGTGTLVFNPYEEIKLPTQVYATFGNSLPALYNIKWDITEADITPVYTGYTYRVNAKIGNIDIGYYEYKNITITIKSYVMTDWKLRDKDGTYRNLDLTFDPYHVTGDATVVDALNVNMYPRYLYVKYEGNDDYVEQRVEWNLSGVNNNYKGGITQAQFRITSDDPQELQRIQAAGYQTTDVAITIMDATVADYVIDGLADVIDPMHMLYVKRDSSGDIVDYIDYMNTSIIISNKGLVFNIAVQSDLEKLVDYKPELVVYDTVNGKIVDPTDAYDRNCYPTTVSVIYKNGTVATFEAPYTLLNYFDDAGGVVWYTDGVKLDYEGGTYNARLKIGNAYGGYQTIQVPIEIASRKIASINLRAVRDSYVFNPYLYTDYALDEALYPKNGFNLYELLTASENELGNVIFESQAAGYYPIVWDLTEISQNYAGGEYNAKAKIGSSAVGYQTVKFKVIIQPKVVKNLLIDNFVFDPYDTSVNPLDKSAYPSTITVRFTDDTNFEFNNVTWDLSAIGEIWNVFGGKRNIKAKIGNALGGYQLIDVPVTVENRYITEFQLNAGNSILFDPYGILASASALDPRLAESYPATVPVIFGGFSSSTEDDIAGTVNVTWDVNNVINDYHGYASKTVNADGTISYYKEYTVIAQVGNGNVGYQYYEVTVRVLNREIERLVPEEITIDPFSTDDLTSTVTILFKDGEEGSMPVEWTNKNYDIYVLGREVDNSNASIYARIGNHIGGYQVFPVKVNVMDKTVTEIYNGNDIVAKSINGKLVTFGFDYVIDGVVYTRESSYFEIDPLEQTTRLVTVSSYKVNGETKYLYVKDEVTNTLTAYFEKDGTTRNLNATWLFDNVVDVDYNGKDFYSGNNNGTHGVDLEVGTARVGYLTIEYRAIVLNRKVSQDVTTVNGETIVSPAIYTSYTDETHNELLEYIVDDVFNSASYPNVLYFRFASSAVVTENVTSKVVNWTKGEDTASITIGNQKYGYQTFTFKVYKVSRDVSYDSFITPDDPASYNQLVDGIANDIRNVSFTSVAYFSGNSILSETFGSLMEAKIEEIAN